MGLLGAAGAKSKEDRGNATLGGGGETGSGRTTPPSLGDRAARVRQTGRRERGTSERGRGKTKRRRGGRARGMDEEEEEAEWNWLATNIDMLGRGKEEGEEEVGHLTGRLAGRGSSPSRRDVAVDVKPITSNVLITGGGMGALEGMRRRSTAHLRFFLNERQIENPSRPIVFRRSRRGAAGRACMATPSF